MVSGGEENYAVYMPYREAQEVNANRVILGSFTKSWAVHPIDKPFKYSLLDYDPAKTARLIARRIYELQEEKSVSIDELLRLAELDADDYARITDSLNPAAPTVHQLERIAKVLGVHASDILPF